MDVANGVAAHPGEAEARLRWGGDEGARQERMRRVLFDRVPEQYIERIEGASYFFLATAGDDGSCDCSFKGGGPGIIRFLSPATCLFPDFAGNDLYMSLGNLLVNPHVGMLFIDFVDGARLRINGTARILDGGAELDRFSDAARVIEVQIQQVVLNCARFVPRMISADMKQR